MTVSDRYSGDYTALRHGAGAVLANRDVLLVSGPDAADFLQGQLSADIAALGPGKVAPSLLLRPDGKLQCWLRVTRLGAEEFACDLAAGLGEAARARLERFKLRVAVELELQHLKLLAVRGATAPPSPEVEAATGGGNSAASPLIVAPVRWGGVPGWDLIAEQVTPPADVRLCELDAFEVLRIEAGIPKAGAELTDGLIPAEAGVVAATVSFTKGCYVGQELIARIDSRGGNTPRRLRGVVIAGDEPPAADIELLDNSNSVVGRITSSAFSPTLEAAVALAYVHRRLEPPAKARLGATDGRCCEIRTLPLVS